MHAARPKASLNASGRWRWIKIWRALILSSVCGQILIGRGAETEVHIDEALRLSPRDSPIGGWGAARASRGTLGGGLRFWRDCLFLAPLRHADGL